MTLLAVLARLGSCCQGLCESGPPHEEPAHLKLERARQERDEELRLAKLRAAEEAARLAEEAERKAREWQAELAELEKRRAGMREDELEKDCLPYFATFEILNAMNPAPEAASEDASPVAEIAAREACSRNVDAASPTTRTISGSISPVEPAPEPKEPEEAPPENPVELWLAELFWEDLECAEDGAAARLARSFGELSCEACEGLTHSMCDALSASSQEAATRACELRGASQKVSRGLSEQLERLVDKYAPTESSGASSTKSARDEPAIGQPSAFLRLESTVAAAEAEVWQARAKQLRAIGDRVRSLLPVVEDDDATSRLVMALAAIDTGVGAAAKSGARVARISLHASFRAPLLAPSTADACWALRSEKRHVVFERMLPGAGAADVWLWPELRALGVGWWLQGSGCLELQDRLVTRCAQSKVAQLRHHLEKEKEWDMDMARTSQAIAKGMVDEAVFWSALKGAKLATLQALLRTGLLSSEPAMAALLEHQQAGDAQFLRKNAFRLLQLHRFHLAAALFVLGDSMEEAVRVVAGHLRDLQLALLLVRRRREAAEPLLRDTLRESSFAHRDPWLRLLLGWHLGSADAMARCVQDGSPVDDTPDRKQTLVSDSGLFDGTLRSSGSLEGLREVADALIKMLASGS